MKRYNKSMLPNLNLTYFYADWVGNFRLRIIKIHCPEESSSKRFIGINLLEPLETIFYEFLDNLSPIDSRYNALQELVTTLTSTLNIALYVTDNILDIFKFIEEHQKITWEGQIESKLSRIHAGLEPDVRYQLILDSMLNDSEIQEYLKHRTLSQLINLVHKHCYSEIEK